MKLFVYWSRSSEALQELACRKHTHQVDVDTRTHTHTSVCVDKLTTSDANWEGAKVRKEFLHNKA